MPNSYKTILKPATCETLNQGSKFICVIEPIKTVDDAKNLVLRLKKEHPFASHVCYAFSLLENGGKSVRTKSSDDKEPAGTAGKPMLDALLNNEIYGVCACVVRYFGGTLLGASNLLRAYVNAVLKTLEVSKIVEKVFVAETEIFIGYNEVAKIEKFLIDEKVKTINTDFAEDVIIEIGIPVDKKDEFIEKLNNILGRKVEFEEKGKSFI